MSQSVTRLKELLFSTEARNLDTVFEQAGSEERLKSSVARVIDGALKEAEANRHDQVSRALAPLIAATVATTIDNSKERIAQAIQPQLGVMVMGFIQSAINDLMVKINERIENSITPRGLRRAKRTGLSPAELALADSERFEVDEMYLLRRGSGELVAHWQRNGGAVNDGAGQGSNRGAIVSGFVAGISAFAEEAFDAKSSSLRTIDVQDARIFVRGSPSYLLAAKCRGHSTGPVEAAIDAQFLATLERHEATLARSARPGRGSEPDTEAERAQLAAILPELGQELERELAARRSAEQSAIDAEAPAARSLAPVYTLIGVVLLPLAAWALWSAYLAFETRRTRIAAETVLATMPELRGYPLILSVDSGGQAITLSGLAPTAEARTQLIDGMRTAPRRFEVRDQLAVLPESGVTDQARSGLARVLARTKLGLRGLGVELAALGQRDANSVERTELDGARAALETVAAGIDTLERQIARERPALEAMVAPLERVRADLADAEARIDRLLGRPANANPPTAARDARALADDVMLSTERLSLAPIAIQRRAETDRLARALATLTARVESIGPTPREKLEAFVRGNAVFFANNTDYRDDRQRKAVLDQLVVLLQAAPVQLRVVGHTDERGTSVQNLGLAMARAERVVGDLVQRGVLRDRLVPVGRASVHDISVVTGPGSPNRRVEFEIGFAGEIGR